MNENSLILLDELGSGTDPLEGANLAISILEYIKNKGALTIATTHYPELKKYALVTKGFENASVEFDIKTLSPTYKLLIGIPGRSNAFEISKRLGLPDEIINNAKKHFTNQDINIEELLKNIYDSKIQIEKEKEEIIKESNQISLLRKSLENENNKVKQNEQELINNAKIKARDILLDAKNEANKIIKQLNNSTNAKELSNLRNSLNDSIKNIKIEYKNDETNNKDLLSPDEIKMNMEVFVTTLGQYGTIVSHVSKNNDVQVQVGNIKTSINIKNLKKVTNSNNKKQTNIDNSSFHFSKSKNIKPEINVIGMNVEEAIFVIDKFIDDCYIAKLKNIRIIHGKGTGKLKTGIHNYLKKNSHIKSFRIGTYGEGEMGVTVVELKE